MPWEKGHPSWRPERPRELARLVFFSHGPGFQTAALKRRANSLAAFQAAPRYQFSTQGIGLRPQP